MASPSFEPSWFCKPGDTIARLMSQCRMNLNFLARALDLEVETARRLLNGLVPVDEETAARLSNALGGSPSFWLKRQLKYEERISQAIDRISESNRSNWLRQLPIREIVGPSAKTSSLSSYRAIHDSMAYFGVCGPDEWEERYGSSIRNTAFRTSPSFESNVGALSVWLRRGEIEASLVSCHPWNPQKLRSSISAIRTLSLAKSPAFFIPKLRSICSAAGVAVAIVRAPKGVRASGATRFISPRKAVLILTFRYLSDDQFWFTVFHEIGHLLLHRQDLTFIDENFDSQSRIEGEANLFAAGALIPGHTHGELERIKITTKSIIRFAVSIGIAPGIVVGQMQHMKLVGPSQLNSLKRRYKWDDISEALD